MVTSLLIKPFYNKNQNKTKTHTHTKKTTTIEFGPPSRGLLKEMLSKPQKNTYLL